MGAAGGRKAPARLALGTAFALLGVTAVAGCAPDAKRATLCRRAVPAVAPPGTTVSVLRVGAGPASDTVRVDYRIDGRPGRETRPRWVVCGFGPGNGLVSLATETGPMNGAALYLLKRYYLDTPGALAADPAGR